MPARNFVENNTLHASFQTIALVGKPRSSGEFANAQKPVSLAK